MKRNKLVDLQNRLALLKHKKQLQKPKLVVSIDLGKNSNDGATPTFNQPKIYFNVSECLK